MKRIDRENEVAQLRLFCRLLGIASEPTPQGDGEGADFVIEWTGSTVGIEVTSTWRSSEDGALPRQIVEAHRRRMMEYALTFWGRTDLSPVDVRCHFNNRIIQQRTSIRLAAQKLVEAVASGLEENEGRDFELRRPGDQRLPRAVHTAFVRCKPLGLESNFMMGGDSSWMVDLTVNGLQASISAKNALLPQYRAAQSSCWLLVVLESERFSGDQRVTEDLLAHEFESGFDRTCLLDSMRELFWQLRTVPPRQYAT